MWIYVYREVPYIPNENTIVYYKLNSETTTKDLSWNNYNLTNAWSVSFWTYNWVDCAYFSETWPYWLYLASWPSCNWPYTYSCWINQIRENLWWYPRIFWGNNVYLILLNYKTYMPRFANAWIPYTEWWHLITMTGDLSDWSFIWYKDWEKVCEWTWYSRAISWLSIWWKEQYPASSVDRFRGYMSDLIFENKITSQDEISEYYRLSKSKYNL
jgi:hypothetical protein